MCIGIDQLNTYAKRKDERKETDAMCDSSDETMGAHSDVTGETIINRRAQ